MTRQDQIIQAASEMFKDSEMRVPNMYCFKQGAEWADSHPVWRKCEEELPKNDDYVLVAYKPIYPIYDNEIRYELAKYWENEVWIGKRGKIDTTQAIAWLPLPPAPKFNPMK